MEEIKVENTNTKKSSKESFFELLRFALLALLVVVPVRLFVIEPFVVSGSSMLPTFENEDYLIIDKLSYELGEPKRDEIVIFRYPKDPTKFFIKRIIGLPGEIIDIRDGIVTITSENKKKITLEEPYIKSNSHDSVRFELKDNEYFVMGDNRNHSSDSRYWGAVTRELIVGKPLLRLLPINNIDILPGNYKQEEK